MRVATSSTTEDRLWRQADSYVQKHLGLSASDGDAYWLAVDRRFRGLVGRPLVQVRKAARQPSIFDETEHPRHPRGHPKGGKFRDKPGTPDMFAATEPGGPERREAAHDEWHREHKVAEDAHDVRKLLRDLDKTRKPGVVKPETEAAVLAHLAHIRSFHPELVEGRTWDDRPISGTVPRKAPKGPPKHQDALFHGVEGEGGQQSMMLEKSQRRPRVRVQKGKPIKGRPGYRLMPVVTKQGKQTRRWQRIADDEPLEEPSPRPIDTAKWGDEEYPLIQHDGLPPPAPPFPDAVVIGYGKHTGPVWEHGGKAWKRAVHRVQRLTEMPDGTRAMAVHEYRNEASVECLQVVAHLPRVPSGVEVMRTPDVTYVGHTLCLTPEEVGEREFWFGVEQQDVEDIEATLREAAEMGIQLNDTIQLAYDPAKGDIVIIDWSNAHWETPTASRWSSGYMREITELYRSLGNDDMAAARELAVKVRSAHRADIFEEGTDRRYVYGSFNRPTWGGMMGTIRGREPGSDPKGVDPPDEQAEVAAANRELRLPLAYVLTVAPLSAETCDRLELTPLHIPPALPGASLAEQADEGIARKSQVKAHTRRAPTGMRVRVRAHRRKGEAAPQPAPAPRKQPSPEETQAAQEAKFRRIADFAERVPDLIKTYKRELKKPDTPQSKVIAVAVALMDRLHFRIGTERYAKQHETYGATTLRPEHVEVSGNRVRFRFTGKKGVQWDSAVTDKALAQFIQHLVEDGPGDRLLWYYPDGDPSKDPRPIRPEQVNGFLHEYGITAKDLRTYHATRIAYEKLKDLSREPDEEPLSKREVKKRISRAIRETAEEMGHTPAVCKSSYILPAVLEDFAANGGALTRPEAFA